MTHIVFAEKMTHIVFGLVLLGFALWVAGIPAPDKHWWTLMVASLVFLTASTLEFIMAVGAQ